MTQMTRIFADSERHADESQHPLKNKGIAGMLNLIQYRNDEQILCSSALSAFYE